MLALPFILLFQLALDNVSCVGLNCGPPSVPVDAHIHQLAERECNQARLARATLRLCNHIPPFHDREHGTLLNGRRLLKAKLVDA